MQHVNFEKIVKSERSREKQVYDEFMPKGRKLNKTQRGISNKRNWKEVA